MKYDFERFLNIRSASAPTFSPDGRRLAFISDITGVPQVWAVDIDGGWPDQLTFYPERVMTAAYSPASDRLVVGFDNGGDERQQLQLLGGDGGPVAPLTDNPDVIHTFGAWSPDGTAIAYASNLRDRAFFDVYIRDLARGEVRMVYQHDSTNVVVGWSPDGGALLISRTVINRYNELYLLYLNRSRPRRITPGEGKSMYASPYWSADRKALYLLSNQDREYMGAAHLDLATKELGYVYTTDWDVELLAYAPKTHRNAYSVNVDGYSEAGIFSISEGRVVPVTGLPRGTLLDMKWSSDGETLAVSLSGATANPDVWLVDGSSGEAKQLTSSAGGGIPRTAFTEPELVHYPTFDGKQIPSFFYTPANTSGDGNMPVVVFVHGGPESQSRPNFNPVVQYLVHRGYGVLVPNVRGSTGYGSAYEHLDDVEKRMDAVKDLKHAQGWLIESGYSRPERIAVMGGSYGGFMVLAAITTYPDAWGAAAEMYGIANFETFLANIGPWRRTHRAAEYGDPERDAELLRSISPIHKVDRIAVPLIIVHGANDPRVPISETEQMVEAIRAREGVVEYVRFEDEGHGIVKRHNRIHAYTAIADFLDRYVMGSPES